MGIIAANIYTSPQYNKIKERLKNRQKLIQIAEKLIAQETIEGEEL